MPNVTTDAYDGKFPRLRDIEVRTTTHEGEEFFVFHDREGVAQDAELSCDFGPLLRLLDGARTADEICVAYAASGGETLPAAWLQNFLNQLDEALLLESPRFQAASLAKFEKFLHSPTRAATLAGRAYPDDARELRAQLDGYFQTELVDRVRSKSTVLPQGIRGCIVPHIDFGRGGETEALAYASLLGEHFDTLVILGIAHGGVRYPFALLKQDFQTPLGTAQCDREFCDALAGKLDARLTSEPFAHSEEHSVEFVTVFAQHLKNLREAKIVPIVCGGFFRELQNQTSPAANADIAAFASALRQTCDAWQNDGKRVGIICSVDGAHVGSNFGDDSLLTPQRLKHIESEDLAAWRCVESGEREAFHAALAKDNNARHVDAHPAVYVTLLAFPQWRARLLHYDQAYSAQENSVVSFAALQLYEP